MKYNIIIDGNNFSDLEGFYDEMEKLLTKDLTWKPGRNLDAFNDLLRGGFGVHEYGEKLHITWIHFSKSRKDFGYEETEKYYEKMLKKCHPSNISRVEKKLEEVRRHEGQTLLDIIIRIITDSGDSGHWCELEIEE